MRDVCRAFRRLADANQARNRPRRSIEKEFDYPSIEVVSELAGVTDGAVGLHLPVEAYPPAFSVSPDNPDLLLHPLGKLVHRHLSQEHLDPDGIDRLTFAFSCEIPGVQTPVRRGDRVSWAILECRFRRRSHFGAPVLPVPKEKARNGDFSFGVDPVVEGSSRSQAQGPTQPGIPSLDATRGHGGPARANPSQTARPVRRWRAQPGESTRSANEPHRSA